MLLATNDAQAIQTFLLEYRHQPLTYRLYLKEIERLVLWCVYALQMSVSDLKREHLIQYQEFLRDPQPSAVWCGPKKNRALRSGEVNPEWRPFVSGLSAPTLRKSTSVLDSFFNYLVQHNYLSGNPMAIDKRKKGVKSNSTDRWLEREEIVGTLEALSLYEQENPTKSFEVARAQYIILTLFYTGLRLAEVSQHTMGNFVLMEDHWYLKVVGKGQKLRSIVVVDEYLEVLVRFRKALELDSPFPTYGETTPLIPALDKRSSITDNRVSQILRWAFDIGAAHFEKLSQEGSDQSFFYVPKASKLRQASAHWIRHSYGTYLVKSGCPIEKVRQLMGHADISTTMIYVHFAKSDLIAAVSKLSLNED